MQRVAHWWPVRRVSLVRGRISSAIRRRSPSISLGTCSSWTRATTVFSVGLPARPMVRPWHPLRCPILVVYHSIRLATWSSLIFRTTEFSRSMRFAVSADSFGRKSESIILFKRFQRQQLWLGQVRNEPFLKRILLLKTITISSTSTEFGLSNGRVQRK